MNNKQTAIRVADQLESQCRPASLAQDAADLLRGFVEDQDNLRKAARSALNAWNTHTGSFAPLIEAMNALLSVLNKQDNEDLK